MAGNLDDFLKRAAQRRAQSEASKRGQQRQQAAPPRRRPEYTDQRRERQVVMTDDDDDVVVAEVVPGIRGEAKPYRQFPTSSSGELQAPSDNSASIFEASARDAAVVSVTGQAASEAQSGQRGAGLPDAAVVERPAAHPLVAVFKNPQSIAQAILMREILDRPVDRW